MKKRMVSGEYIFTLVVLVFSILMFVQSLNFTPKGRLFPVIIVGGLIVLLAIKVVSIRNPKVAATMDTDHGLLELPGGDCVEETSMLIQSKAKLNQELCMMGWIVFLVALALLVGFLIAIPIFLFLFLLLQGRHSVKVSIITTVAVQLGVYVLFILLLNTHFPSGYLI